MVEVVSLRCVLVLALGFWGFAAGAVEISGGTADDREKMIAVVEKWLDSYAAGDLDGIMSLMHEDALLMPHNQATSRGLDAVRAYFAARIGRPGVELVDDLQEIRINGDWAYVRGKFRFEIDLGPDDAPIIHHGRYLIIYEKVDGDWKLLRDMDNLDAVAPPAAAAD